MQHYIFFFHFINLNQQKINRETYLTDSLSIFFIFIYLKKSIFLLILI